MHSRPPLWCGTAYRKAILRPRKVRVKSAFNRDGAGRDEGDIDFVVSVIFDG
jgi:hypothetical protein